MRAGGLKILQIKLNEIRSNRITCSSPTKLTELKRLSNLSEACAYIQIEPGHEKMCLMSYANNKGADQPAHPRSLISAFVFAA